jgi:tetratricopeptide (TPR) repeat protein
MIIGNIELAQNKYVAALERYQECLDLAEINGFDDLIPHLQNNLGNLYLSIEDYGDAEEALNKAYTLFMNRDDLYNAALVRSNIAIIQRVNGELDQALEGYLDAITTFSRQNRWNEMSSGYEAITQIYIDRDDLVSAHRYLELALNTIDTVGLQYEGPSSRLESRIYTTAGQLYLDLDSLAVAKRFGQLGLEVARTNSYLKDVFENCRTLGEIYDREGILDSALYYNKQFIDYYDQYASESDARRITQVKMQHQFDRLLREREVENVRQEAAYKRNELLYISGIIITIFLIVLIWSLYRNQKAKTSRVELVRQNLELEKQTLNQEIEYKKKELASQMMYMIEKNEFISTIARKLIELKPNSKKDQQLVIQQLITELRSNSSNKVWSDFELRFKEVNAGFYESLNQMYPDLTPNEVRLCAFLKLNMSTKEISSITHQSVKSINMARFRLRKKLDIDRDENLISFLTQL